MNRKPVATLILSAATVLSIAGWEQYRGNAYMPTPNDVPTIGWGTTQGVKMGDKTEPTRALRTFIHELDTVYVAAVKRYVKVPLSDNEFGALVSFTQNNGAEALRTSTLLKKLNAGDYAGACAEISRWNKQWTGKRDANGKKVMVVLDGLTARREEERAVCEGKYAES